MQSCCHPLEGGWAPMTPEAVPILRAWVSAQDISRDLVIRNLHRYIQFSGWHVNPVLCTKKLIFVINGFVFRPKRYWKNNCLSKKQRTGVYCSSGYFSWYFNLDSLNSHVSLRYQPVLRTGATNLIFSLTSKNHLKRFREAHWERVLWLTSDQVSCGHFECLAF